MDNVHPFLFDGLCLKYKRCLVQNKDMGCINVTETVCAGKSTVITLEATWGRWLMNNK